MCVCVSSVHMPQLFWCPQRPEEGGKSPGSYSYEPANMGVGNKTRVLCKSGTCSYSVRLFSDFFLKC